MLRETSGIIQDGIKLANFNSTSGWVANGSLTAPDSTLTVDETTFFEGGASLNFNSTGTGLNRWRQELPVPVDLSGVDVFSIWTDWNTQSTSTSLSLRLHGEDDSDFPTDYASATLFQGLGRNRTDGGQYSITFNKSDFTLFGSFDWADVRAIQFRWNMQAANENIRVGALYCGRRRKTQVVLCFDDGVKDSDFDMVARAEDANAQGVPITHYPIYRFIDGVGYMTTDDLKERQKAGDLVAVHSAPTGGNYSAGEYTSAEVEADLLDQIGWLRSHDFNGSEYMAWPAGRYWRESNDESYIQAAYNVGIKSGRSIIGIVQVANGVEKINLGLVEPMIINSTNYSGPSGEQTASALLAELDKAIAQGTCIFFYGHKISTGSATPSGYELTGDEFDIFLAGLKARMDAGACEAVTHKEFYESLEGGYLRSGITSSSNKGKLKDFLEYQGYGGSLKEASKAFLKDHPEFKLLK